MSETIDVSGDRQTDWDKEVAAGHLVRKVPAPGNFDGADHHIQGIPITAEEQARREVSAEVMKHVQETGRYPDAPRGTVFAMGGWPVFDAEGKIVG